MMDMIITFQINSELFKQFDSFHTDSLVRYLLMDALGEFKSVRSPTNAYVKQRYAYMGEAEQLEKMKQVEDRSLLAGLMHSGIWDIKFQHRSETLKQP